MSKRAIRIPGLQEFWATCGCKFVLPIGHPATGENGCTCAKHGRRVGFWAVSATLVCAKAKTLKGAEKQAEGMLNR